MSLSARSRAVPLAAKVHIVTVLAGALILVVVLANLFDLSGFRVRTGATKWRVEARSYIDTAVMDLQQGQAAADAWVGGSSAASYTAVYGDFREAEVNFLGYARVVTAHRDLSPAATKALDDFRSLEALPPVQPGAGGVSTAMDEALVARQGSATADLVADVAVVQGADEQWWLQHIVTERATASRDSHWVLGLGGAALALLVIGNTLLSRAAARRQAAADARERELSLSVETNEFEARLQRALDLASDERRVYRVVERALQEALPHRGAELLLADSSRAHFHQLVTTGDLGDGRCSVESPADCPAAQRGAVLAFPSSGALDACPYLQSQAEPCSAVCVPVSVSGTTVGVVHAAGPPGEQLPRNRRVPLELVARRASDRVGMLRAFARSEVQANTDALTGLPNRRALEDQVHHLDLTGVSYAVAFGDLDRFKMLNDVHGHAAGDQALRLFARSMASTLRPDDLVGRYGGEEFVVVLPRCGADEAAVVVERIRSALGAAIRDSGGPSFTVSFGLAPAQPGVPFETMVGLADAGLLQAKAQGRDRLVVVGGAAGGAGGGAGGGAVGVAAGGGAAGAGGDDDDERTVDPPDALHRRVGTASAEAMVDR